MSLLETPAKFDAEKALRVQVGLMSPLWLPVAGAAAMGLAAWNFTRWMRLAAPEGVAEFKAVVEKVVAEAETEAEAVAEPVLEAIEETVEDTVAVAADAVTEAPLPEIKPEAVVSPAQTVAAVAQAQAEAVEPVAEAQAEVAKAALAAPKTVAKKAVTAAKKPAVRKPRPTAH